MFKFVCLKKQKYARIKFDHEITDKEFKDFFYRWNINNPMDRWYREKYGIQFNSPKHRISCLIDICFEFKEDVFYNEIFKDNDEEKYDPLKGNWLKSRDSTSKIEDLSNEELADLFTNSNMNE